MKARASDRSAAWEQGAASPLLLQRAAVHAGETPGVPPIVHDVLRSPGQPLHAAARANLEPRLGHDFSRVRVHTNARAAESARAVSALAFTVGHDVVFGVGQYAPETAAGQRLLAHELAHTVQQSAAHGPGSRPLLVGAAGSAWEREAERAALTSAGSHGVPRLSPASLQVQRQPQGAVAPPLCPVVGASESKDDLLRAMCLRGVDSKMRPDCSLRPEQSKLLRSAQAEALSRVRRALSRIRTGREGRAFAADLAQRLFTDDVPSVDRVIRVLERVRGLLSSSANLFAGRTCTDPACGEKGASAYVTGPNALPMFVCPITFNKPEEAYRVVLHEAIHWTGIDADPATPEGYCEKFDCVTPCLGSDTADAWSHYLSCLGEPLTLRRDFRQKILESVNELP